MKCVEALRRIDDLVDGTLPRALAAELEGHLESCESCRRAERGLRALLSRVDGLERDIEPPRDLWKGIAARIGAEKAPPRRMPALARLPLLAAAAALAIGLAGALSLSLLSRGGTAGRALAYRPRPLPVSFARAPALAESHAALEAARAELYAALGERKASLAPKTLRVIEENLRIIDDAAARIGAALEKDPGDEELAAFLVRTYESEIRLLRRATLEPGRI